MTLGHNVIVRNEAGASGAVGTRAVARAEPDGHIITFGNNQTHGNNMFLLKDPGYDAVRDFAPLVSTNTPVPFKVALPPAPPEPPMLCARTPPRQAGWSKRTLPPPGSA